MTQLKLRIAENRRKLGLTQEQLANQLGISAGAVSKWENGSTAPDISLLPPLARALHITLDELFDFQIQLTPQAIKDIKDEVRTCMLQESYADGLRLLNHYLRQYPANGSLLLSAGTLIMMYAPLAENADEAFIYEQYQKAASYLQAVIDQQDPKLTNSAMFSKAYCLLSLQAYEECEKLLKSLQEQTIDASAIILSLYEKQERFEEAKHACQGLLLQEINKCISTLSVLARLSEDKEQMPLLVLSSQLEELFQIPQGSSQLLLCHCCLSKQNYSEAAHYFKTYIERTCTSSYNYDKHPIFKGIRLEVNEENQRSVRKHLLESLLKDEKYEVMSGYSDYDEAIQLIKTTIDNNV